MRTTVDADELRQAWQTPEVQALLCAVLERGMFRDDPALARMLLDALEAGVAARRPGEAVYDDLHTLLHRDGTTERFRGCFDGDEAARIERRVRQLAALVPEGETPGRYVDVGCGTGQVTAGLARAWSLPPERVAGVEVFERSLAKGAFTPVPFRGRTIPLPDGSHDLATLIMVLHHEADAPGLLAEVCRVLRPGGLLLVRETDAATPEHRLFNRVMEQFYYRVFNRLPGVPNPVTHRGADEWRGLFRATGFSPQREERPEPDNPFRPVHFVLRKQG
jgi:ubiquinone/menaquinone biosynthesis C-methylase UbiE